MVGSRFRRTCSTGITRRRFFGSFDRAYANKKKIFNNKKKLFSILMQKASQLYKWNVDGANVNSRIEFVSIKFYSEWVGGGGQRKYHKYVKGMVTASFIYLRMRIKHGEIADDDWHG